MALKSRQFAHDQRLRACLVSQQAHIAPGAAGTYVTKIQEALILLDGVRIDPHEIVHLQYGPSTARAVLAYKTKRRIINHSYQASPDDIVGEMTIAALDDEMLVDERGSGGAGHRAAINAGSASIGAGSRRSPPRDSEYEADSAGSYYQNVCRTLVEDGRPDWMVTARSHHLRWIICQEGLNIAVNGTFDPKYWDAVSPHGGTAPSPPPTWCGIFATWIWAKKANLSVEWGLVNSNSSSNGPYRTSASSRIQTSNEKRFIAPGDIVVQPAGNHHLLVLAVAADHGKAFVIAGNEGAGVPTDQTVVHRRHYDMHPVTHFYSVDSYRWPQWNYGTNFDGHRP
jgi:hypothetical protein